MQNLLIKVYKNPRLSRLLSICTHTISVLCALAFFYVLLNKVYDGEYKVGVVIAVCAMIGYVAVSITRALINAPRPYELHDFYEKKPKERSGRSFPSRHAYSAAVISTLSLSVGVWLFIPLASLTVIMCVCRALLGIHFIRDLAAGVLLGAVAGAIGLLLI